MNRNFSILRCYLAIFALLAVQNGNAQDTTLLQTVNVTALKSMDFSAGKGTDQIDSSTKQNFTFHSLADLLQLNSGIFIKNYGPGALAGTSMRGGNASQTAILWNGINIQNAMLGQNDLSLLPSVMFNDMKVEYGGSSALWGSGAVAGSILLGNKADFNKGFETKVNVAKASFGTFKTSAVLNYSNRKIFSSTKVYLHNSNNDFTYVKNVNGRDSLYRLKNSVFSIKGFMQQVKFLLDPFQSLEFNFWADQAERQLALNTDVNFKPAVQKDENIRAQLSWNKNKNKWNQTWKTALLSNAIIYNNENAGTHDFSRVLSAILENENIYRYSAKSQMILGMNSNISEAISDAYLKKQSIYKVSVLAGNRSLLFNDKMEINTVLRGEYFSTTTLPFTGNIGISYAPLKGLKVGVNAAKIYRQPTLNELYWYPGGNKDLKAEEGYSLEGDLSYELNSEKTFLLIGGSAYSRTIDNWILWLPGIAGSPTPQNIQSVWSRGTESRMKIGYRNGKWLCSLQFYTAYTLSTVEKEAQDNGETKGKQLIYTPRYIGNANAGIAYKKFSIYFYQHYTGYRFTSSDNKQWLDPYHYSDLRINYSGNIGETTQISLYLAAYNIFNENYTVISGRPMPRMSFEIGISLGSLGKKSN